MLESSGELDRCLELLVDYKGVVNQTGDDKLMSTFYSLTASVYANLHHWAFAITNQVPTY